MAHNVLGAAEANLESPVENYYLVGWRAHTARSCLGIVGMSQ